MKPVEIEMIRGDELVLGVNFTDENLVPIDDPTAEYRMTAKRNITDADPGVFSVTAFQDSAGHATLVVPSSATSPLETAILTLVYDIQVTETGGRVSTIQTGNLVVSPDVSVVTP